MDVDVCRYGGELMIIAGLPPLIIGFVCVFFARAIQQFALDSRREGSLFYNWIASDAYVVSVRVVGGLLIAIAALIVYAA